MTRTGNPRGERSRRSGQHRQWTCRQTATTISSATNSGAAVHFTYRIEITGKSVERASLRSSSASARNGKPSPCRAATYAAVVNVIRENIGCDAVFEAVSCPGVR
jgi:hypothetical protein